MCSLDGTTFSVAVPELARVGEVKRAIDALREEVPYFAIELFVAGNEDRLPDEKQMVSTSKVPLFMMLKALSDRLALEAIFKNTGGENWEDKTGWEDWEDEDADIGD